MKHISSWANLNNRLSISIIILIEISKGWIGIYLGFRALTALPAMAIELAVFAIIVGIFFIKSQFIRQANLLHTDRDQYHRLRRWSTFGLFMCSFLLAVLLGNRCQSFVAGQSSSFTAQAAVYYTTSEKPTTPSTYQQPESRPLTRRELRHERRLTIGKNRRQPHANEPSAGIFILLALLSFGLAYLGAGLSCSLSCSNQGTAAVLVAVLAVGVLAAGIYFIYRAIRRGVTNRKKAPVTN